MVDGARGLEAVLPELALLLDGAGLPPTTPHSTAASCARRLVEFGRDWRNPPVLCTASLARATPPLQRERRLTTVAGALGIDVETAHRALADAETCARVLCALFPRLCANAVTVGDALAAAGAPSPAFAGRDAWARHRRGRAPN